MESGNGAVGIELRDSASFTGLGPNDDLFRTHHKSSNEIFQLIISHEFRNDHPHVTQNRKLTEGAES